MDQHTLEALVAWAVIDFAAYCSASAHIPPDVDFVPLLTAWASQQGMTLEHANPDDWDRFKAHRCFVSPTVSASS